MADVHRHCDERFAAVREAFAASFEAGNDGASFAATVNGEVVVDLWGEFADEARMPTTKRMTALPMYQAMAA